MFNSSTIFSIQPDLVLHLKGVALLIFFTEGLEGLGSLFTFITDDFVGVARILSGFCDRVQGVPSLLKTLVSAFTGDCDTSGRLKKFVLFLLHLL